MRSQEIEVGKTYYHHGRQMLVRVEAKGLPVRQGYRGRVVNTGLDVIPMRSLFGSISAVGPFSTEPRMLEYAQSVEEWDEQQIRRRERAEAERAMNLRHNDLFDRCQVLYSQRFGESDYSLVQTYGSGSRFVRITVEHLAELLGAEVPTWCSCGCNANRPCSCAEQCQEASHKS